MGPPQSNDGPVIRPDEEEDDEVEEIGANDKGPHGPAPEVQRRHLGDGGNALEVLVHLTAADDVDGYEDAAADEGAAEEDVAAHFGEAEKQGGVDADLLDQELLLRHQDGRDPGEDSLADGRRRVFFVGMHQARCVDNAVVGPQQAEEEGNDDGEDEGGGERGNDGIGLDLRHGQREP